MTELSGVESDTAALTRIGRKTLALREAAELLEENQCLRGTIEALKERLMRAETEVSVCIYIYVYIRIYTHPT